MSNVRSDGSVSAGLEKGASPIAAAEVGTVVLPPPEATVDALTMSDPGSNGDDNGDEPKRNYRAEIQAGLARLSARADYLQKTRCPLLLWNHKPFEWPAVPPWGGADRYAVSRIENATMSPVPARQIEVYSFGLMEAHGHEYLDAVHGVLEQFHLRCVLDMAQYIQKLGHEIVKHRKRRDEMFQAFESDKCSRKELDDVIMHVAALERELAEFQGKAPKGFEQQLMARKRKRTARFSLETWLTNPYF